jgi:hypothetical protein
MTDKIDQLNTSYLIPGFELGPSFVADPEEADQDYEDAPYSQMQSLGDIPSPNGWKDMFGLNQVAPGPSQIDPPTRPVAERATSTNATNASLSFPQNASYGGMGAAAASPKVKRMIGMFTAYEQATNRIRARASDGGGQ